MMSLLRGKGGKLLALLAVLAVLPACGAKSMAPMAAEAPSYAASGKSVTADAEMLEAEGVAISSADAPGAAPAPPPAPPPLEPGPLPAAAGASPAPRPAAQPPAPGQPQPAKAVSPTDVPKPLGAKEPVVEEPKQPTIAQLLIYTGQLQLLAEQEAFPVILDTVVDIAVEMGGYISRQDNQSVQVRVPSARFREALKEMEKLALVTHRQIQVQDVTEEYHDLKVRLKSLKATRDRLEEFLKRAQNISEVLQVEQQLSRLNSEIDRIEGRMRFLSSRAAYSTITVTMQPKPKTQQIVKKTPPPPPPPPRTIPLPIKWLSSVGLERLLQLGKE